MKAARSTPKRARGFTLLELIVAMALTALLLGMLSAGVYAVVNDWQDETSELDLTLDKTLVVLQIERALTGAFPHTYINERFERRVYFQGADDALDFVSAVSPQRNPGLTAWRLYNEDDGVMLKLTPAFADNPDARLEALEPTLLLPGYRASYRYLFQRNPEEKEWLDAWEGGEHQSLPLAVHIVLTPLDAELDEAELEIVAPIRAWRHLEIEPIVPVN
jgi:general secretion pathway protein J